MRLYSDDSRSVQDTAVTTAMGTVEGQFVGWLEAEAVAKPEHDTQAQVASLVQEYSTTLYRVAYSVTRNAADAGRRGAGDLPARSPAHRNSCLRCATIAYGSFASPGTSSSTVSGAPRRGPRPTILKTWREFCLAGDLSAEKIVITAQRYAQILRLIDTTAGSESARFCCFLR